MSGQQEAAGSAGGIADRIVGGRLDTIDDRFDQVARGEVLPGTLGAFGGTLGEQTLINVPFDVGVHRRPLFGTDQVDDQSSECGGVLDLLTGLFEDLAEHARLLAEFFQDFAIVQFQSFSVQFEQALPVHVVRDDRLFVVRRLGLFVGHLEEEQERDLLGVGHVRQSIVPQDVGEVPGFVDDLLAVVGHGLPEAIDAVSVKLWIGADDGNTLRQGLGDEQAIERVIVMERQNGDLFQMFRRNLKPLKITADHVMVEESRILPADIQLFAADLDCDFPRRRHADKFAVGRVADQRCRGRTELGIVPPEPKHGMRVEKKCFHSIYSAKSSRGASKSGAIQKDRSFAVPGWLGQLVRGGRVITATGSPFVVKTISSPGIIPATSSLNFGCTAARGNVRGILISPVDC